MDGAKILRETWTDDEEHTLVPLYDNEDSVCGIVYNNTPYYFQKNLQGDVIGITDEDSTVVACYTYDAWGKVIDISGCDLAIAEINPFRYRGYYWDRDLGLYYLQSRYYDPKTGRFLNADEVEILLYARDVCQTFHLYSYCCNDCINSCDPTGYAHLDLRADIIATTIDLLLYLVPAIPAVNRALKAAKYVPKHAVKTALSSIKQFLIKVLPKLNIGLGVVSRLTSWISDLTGLFPFGASIGGLIAWGLSKMCKSWKTKQRLFVWFGPWVTVTYIRIF